MCELRSADAFAWRRRSAAFFVSRSHGQWIFCTPHEKLPTDAADVDPLPSVSLANILFLVAPKINLHVVVTTLTRYDMVVTAVILSSNKYQVAYLENDKYFR